MNQCRSCPSYAINPGSHGRDNTDLDLCDVCYWRLRAEAVADALAALRAEYAIKARPGQDYNFIYDTMVDSLDTTIAALGLPIATKEK